MQIYSSVELSSIRLHPKLSDGTAHFFPHCFHTFQLICQVCGSPLGEVTPRAPSLPTTFFA